MEGRSAEDCVVLLEELIQSNRKLAAENEKLRWEHEAARRNQTQVLQRIEQRLNEREAPGERHRSRRRAAAHTIAFPVACRVSIKRNVHSNDAKTICYKKNYMKIIHYKTEMTEVGGHAEWGVKLVWMVLARKSCINYYRSVRYTTLVTL